MDMKNKVAIVTGAGKGIGRGIALALAKAGADVVASDIILEDAEGVTKEVEKLGRKALAVRADVSDAGEVRHMVDRTVKKFGHLDILVNNAGIYPFKGFQEMTEKEWEKVIDVNLKGTFLCSQAAAKVMKPGSKIVNISSVVSFIGYQGLVHYCSSKGGVNSMTRAMALELAARKINVNAIAPGAIETPGISGVMDEKTKQQTIAAIPWKRMGKPEDIAHVVVFLASDKADYITGQVLVVDGGWLLQ